MMPKHGKIRRVYMDYAATTPVDECVFSVMKPFFTVKFGNPSALYNLGREAWKVLNDSRKKVAEVIRALPENIFFTSSGTESDNMAVYGIVKANQEKGRHIISLGVEHHAVLKPLADLASKGYEVTYVSVGRDGIVEAEEIIKAIRPDTILITTMYANNEVGSIQPIADIGRAILKYRKDHSTIYPYFHTDACQAPEYLELDVEKMHADLMTINGSKIYGPKGVGMLYVRRGVKIQPIIFGGGQEKGMRPGTENVPAIAGFAKALELAQQNKENESRRLRGLTAYFWKKIQNKISDVRLNGPEIGDKRLPNNLNVSFMNIEGEAMLLYLDEYGIMCSTGSACTSESLEPSHVLRAMGLSYETAHGSLRFTLGRSSTRADIDYTLKYLPGVVSQLREISPVNMQSVKHLKHK